MLHLIKEAEQNFPSTEIGCIVSIGTGVQQDCPLARERFITSLGIPLVGWAVAKLDAIKVIKALATSCEHIHEVAKYTFRNTEIYHRFNCPEGGDIKLYEYKKTAEIKDLTQSYLSEDSTVEAVEACVSQLHIAGDHAVQTGTDPAQISEEASFLWPGINTIFFRLFFACANKVQIDTG
jgi:hypothetical protein